MTLPNEIKIFTKNTLIVALFFALALELSWDYIAPILHLQTNALSDNSQFQQADIIYIWNTATALSLAVWQKESLWNNGWIQLSNSIITISEVLATPNNWQKKLIGWHMQTIQSYVNLLESDIPWILDRATDRTHALDDHIALLRSYGIKVNDMLVILDEQISDLKAIISKNSEDTLRAKNTLQSSLSSLDYNWVDGAIDNYTLAKNSDVHARIYLIYLERFRESYLKLQAKNKKILTTLTENRDPLIKRSVIVIPSAWSDILKELGVIQSEAEYKAKKDLN